MELILKTADDQMVVLEHLLQRALDLDQVDVALAATTAAINLTLQLPLDYFDPKEPIGTPSAIAPASMVVKKSEL